MLRVHRSLQERLRLSTGKTAFPMGQGLKISSAGIVEQRQVAAGIDESNLAKLPASSAAVLVSKLAPIGERLAGDLSVRRISDRHQDPLLAVQHGNHPASLVVTIRLAVALRIGHSDQPPF